MGRTVAAAGLFLILCFVLVAVPDVEAESEPKTIVVPDNYVSIQEAIDNALSGDTVFVKSGMYVNQSLAITKPLSLVGENPETTIIYGKNYLIFPSYSSAIHLDANDVQVSGFTMITSIQVKGISGSGNRTLIENNIIKSANSNGIAVWGDHNIIANNNLTTGVGAIHCSGSNNTVMGNRINSSGSIAIGGSFNTVSGNYLTTSSISVNGNSNTINNNHVGNSVTGIRLNSGSNNVVFENTITNHSFMGIHLYETTNNQIFDNYIANIIGTEGQENGYGISLSGRFYCAENNTFYRNTLINNSYNIRIEEPYYANNWDNGSTGNYWDDYNGTDTNGDDIGDTPYIINENNQDNHPILNYSSIPEFPSWTIMPTLVTAMLAAVIYRKKLHRTQNQHSS